jgi:hypothetical protein
MTVIGSGSMQDPEPLSDQVAERDITEINTLGQTQVIVPAGQRIPLRLVDELHRHRATGKALHAPPEDKAAAKPKRQRRRSEG